MHLITIDNHSLVLDLLPETANILDVGSRNYRFANALAEMGHQVLCLDPDPTVTDPVYRNVRLLRAALVAESAPVHQNLVMTGDPEARYLIELNRATTPWLQEPVRTTTLSMLGFGKRPYWDLLKLNCEGVEFEILNELTGPIADQITFSAHEHTGYRKGKDAWDKLIERLSRWYRAERYVFDERYCAGLNAWDVLLIERGAENS